MLTANLDDRTVTGLVLPFGETGRTNLGRVVASQGSVTIPDASQVTLNLEHRREQPVGRAVSLAETEQGIEGTFRVAATRAGDDLLAEVAEGLRTGLSVELDTPVIRGGRLLSGALSAVAAVVTPAFPSAQMLAADAGDVEEDPEITPAAAEDNAPGDAEDDPEGDQPDTEEEPIVATATAPVGSLLAGKALKADDTDQAPATLFARLAAAGATMQPAKLLAALDEITAADVFSVVTENDFIGQLWRGRSYIDRYAPLIGHASLTGPKVTGWRFVSGKAPTVASYAGFPTQPTSNEVDTEAVEVALSRIAGAWAVDRIHKDFPSAEFWSAFFTAATEDYSRKRDAAVLAHLVASATPVEVGTVPTGVAEGVAKIVDGALSIIDTAVPTFAIVGTDLYREMLLTRSDDSLAFLSTALGVESGSLAGFRIVPSSAASMVDKVLVGSSMASTLHELPGVPVRVDAEAITTGGAETGLFGYYALLNHNAGALALVGDDES